MNKYNIKVDKHGLILNRKDFKPESKPNDPIQISICEEFIKVYCRKRKTFNPKNSSYGLKHAVESINKNVYISNGAFIQAALNLGYDIKPINLNRFNELNCTFNMGIDWKTIRKIKGETK